MTNHSKTVSLVLGGGGARGLAHIGVIQFLEQHNFQIRSIAGTSMGALVGGIHATGRLDVYEKWIRALQKKDMLRLLDFSFTKAGLIKGQKLNDVLQELVGIHNIEELDIAFTAVATDINNEKEVWFDSGPLFEAIRASIGIPLIFSPIEIGGRRLIDGSLINPIPIAPTLTDHTDITIAVNLSGKAISNCPPKELLQPDNGEEKSYRLRILGFLDNLHSNSDCRDEDDLSMFEVIGKSMDLQQNIITRYKLAAYSPDYLVEIPKNVCSFYEFHRANELIEIGHQQAEDCLKELL